MKKLKEGTWWPKSKLSDTFESLLAGKLKEKFKGFFHVDGYDLYRNNKLIMKINPDKDTVNSIVNQIKKHSLKEKAYHFKNTVTGVQQDLNYDTEEEAIKHWNKLGNKRWTMSERIHKLKEDAEYQEFFKNALQKFGKTPGEMDDDEKAEFFNYIDRNWDGKSEIGKSSKVIESLRRRRLKEDSKYQDFFRGALQKFGVKTPSEMTDEEKKKFFNYIDTEWDAKKELDEEKNQLLKERKIRREVRRIFEETGLNKKFNKIASTYHEAEMAIDKIGKEMDNAKSEFLKKFKSANTDEEKEKIKKDHIINMKKLASDLKEKMAVAEKEKRKAELDFARAIQNMAVADEVELLESKSPKVRKGDEIMVDVTSGRGEPIELLAISDSWWNATDGWFESKVKYKGKEYAVRFKPEYDIWYLLDD